MIPVRPEETGDQAEIEGVCASATATLRLSYRPNQKALDNKARLSACLQRLVAVVDSRVVGTVQYYLEDRAVRIIGLGVHSIFRRRGVARSLFRYLEEIGIREQADSLQLCTVKETGNVEVFTHLGFMVVAEREAVLFESDRFEHLTDVELVMKLPQQ